jgi:hypothetical protein
VRPAKSVPANAAPGVIDTLSSGFTQVNRIFWIVGLPIVMDVFLWLAPRLSAAPVFHQLAARLSDVYGNVAGSGVDSSTLDQARQTLGDFDQAAAGFNLLSLLVVNLAGVPSILPTSLTGAVAFEINSGWVFLVVALLAELVGTLIGCLYLGALAQQIRDGKLTPSKLFRRVWIYWLSVIGFVALGIGVCLAISIPIGLAIGLVQVVAPGAGMALWYAALAGAQIVAVLLMIYLFFLVDAIVVSEAGPVRAAVNSARVVANNFWASVGFIVLVYVISLGMQVIWTAMSKSPIGTVAAIVGNAYVATGLTTASLLYYQSRVSRLSAARGVLGRVTQA